MTEPQGEYTIEWFKEVKAMHPEYLGTQAYELLGLYEELEAKNETLRLALSRCKLYALVALEDAQEVSDETE